MVKKSTLMVCLTSCRRYVGLGAVTLKNLNEQNNSAIDV